MTETMDLNKDFFDDEDIIELTFDDDEDIIELTDICGKVLDQGLSEDRFFEQTKLNHGVGTNGAVVLTDKLIEAALLRIIEKRYGKRFDTFFAETVERVVEREIAAIKQILLKNLS